MRAVLFKEQGGLDKLSLQDVPVPEVGPTNVLIRVRACGVNRLDIRVREGKVGVQVEMPHIPGSEIAGEVARVGGQVQDFVKKVRRITSKRGVDLVLEHIGADTWESSAASLSRNGRLVICGTTSGDQANTNLWNLFAKQLTFIGSYGGTRSELRTV
jgi:NADPH:quinone reductase-like Zn-dependent oxidoreductase